MFKSRRYSKAGFYAFSTIVLVLFFLFLFRANWFIAHISVDWNKLIPVCRSVRFTTPILVIESDDWGWSEGNVQQTWQIYQQAGYDFPNYAKYSALETSQEVNSLARLLFSHRDSKDKPAILTANMIMANINFEAVRESEYKELFVVPLNANVPENPVSCELRQAYENAYRLGVFVPQLHGLYHINKEGWLKALQKNAPLARKAFENHSLPLAYGGDKVIEFNSVYCDFSTVPSKRRSYEDQLAEIERALEIFESLFGFKPKSSIPPFYVWDDITEKALVSAGIKYIQAGNMQILARNTDGGFVKRYHSLGQKSNTGIIYLRRSFSFEPVRSASDIDAVKKRIGLQFEVGQPAVINSHRINYVGPSAAEHRAKLDMILGYAESNWNQLHYMSSEELGKIVEERNSSFIIPTDSFLNYYLILKHIIIFLPGVWFPIFAGSNFLLLIIFLVKMSNRIKIL